jgi:hypothetical protein
MRSLIFFILALASALPSWADSQADVLNWATQEKWHEDLQWRKLLHFEPTLFGSLESQIDGDDFFLNLNGKTDLKSELESTIKAFFAATSVAKDADERTNPICRFPARMIWLKSKAGNRNVKWPDVKCPRYENFFEILKGTGVSLVFSSYYLNNPSSAFGHTFLRLNKAPAVNGKRFELLDYGLNYAANRGDENAFVYAIKGLFGLGPGSFTTTPYYYKVREYNNAESRDLWEYELNVQPWVANYLIAHFWELSSTRINYWYLTENCSYHMFTLLEAVDTQVDLLSHLKKYVIPSDTVHAVWEKPGFVKSVQFRPSIRTVLAARLEKLTPEEKKEVFYVMDKEKVSDNFSKLSEISQVNILDAVADFIDFKYAYSVQILDSPALKFKNRILAQRSQLQTVSKDIVVKTPELEKPHESHGSRRVGLGYSASKETPNKYLFDYRFALHDMLDPIQGYPEYAKITFFDFNFSADESSHSVQLEDLTLFEVSAMSPYSDIHKDPSWGFRVASERVRNENCDFCRWNEVTGTFGGTWELADSPLVLFNLGVRGTAAYGDTEKIKWWAGAGPNLQLRVRWTPQLISLVEAWQRWDFQGEERNYFERSFSTQWSWSKDWGVRESYKDYGFDKVSTANLFYYY